MTMQALSATDLVDVWEIGAACGPGARAQLLLERILPEQSPDELRAMPLGTRDALLLQLRKRLFGPHLESLLRCADCGETFEIHLDVDQLLPTSPVTGNEPIEWRENALSVRFRRLTAGDLIDIERYDDAAAARERLLELCLLDAQRDGESIAPAELSKQELSAPAERVAEADPNAELHLNGACPSCGSHWRSLLDVSAYLWTEVERHVARLLTEVHTLARAYGWSEQSILAMSHRRRQTYLSLLLQ